MTYSGRGLTTALVTNFDADSCLDLDGLAAAVRFQIDVGASGLCVLG